MNYKFDEGSSRTCSRWDKVILLFKSSPWHPFVVDPLLFQEVACAPRVATWAALVGSRGWHVDRPKDHSW